jgi:hypothetical protein
MHANRICDFFYVSGHSRPSGDPTRRRHRDFTAGVLTIQPEYAWSGVQFRTMHKPESPDCSSQQHRAFSYRPSISRSLRRVMEWWKDLSGRRLAVSYCHRGYSPTMFVTWPRVPRRRVALPARSDIARNFAARYAKCSNASAVITFHHGRFLVEHIRSDTLSHHCLLSEARHRTRANVQKSRVLPTSGTCIHGASSLPYFAISYSID